jgi:hypothetical protein
MNTETIFTIDWTSVSPQVKEGLLNGTMRYSTSNGNVFWAAGSGKTGMVTNLPLIPSHAVGSEQLLQMASAMQSTVVVAAAVSTAVIVGAIVIQTAYLAAKIDKLQHSVDALSKAVHLQSVISYMNKVTDYFGAVEAARQLMLDPSIADEVAFVAPTVLADLAIRRNGLCSLVERLLALAEDDISKSSSEAMPVTQYQMILSFAIETLSILPAGHYVERELYAFVGKYQLSEHIGRESAIRYRLALQALKAWSNQQLKHVAHGKSHAQCIMEVDADLKALFSNEANEMLLGTYAPRHQQAMVSRAPVHVEPIRDSAGGKTFTT